MSDKLIKEIKQKKPSLQELKIIFKKNKITSREEIHELMMKHNLLKYIYNSLHQLFDIVRLNSLLLMTNIVD